MCDSVRQLLSKYIVFSAWKPICGKYVSHAKMNLNNKGLTLYGKTQDFFFFFNALL